MLKDLSLCDFCHVTSGSDPIPGGGSVSALSGAIAASLTHMVTQLTIGKKKYAEVQKEMEQIAEQAKAIRDELIQDIDRDSDAYNDVFQAFKMPKETDEEKELRTEAIQKYTKQAALIPMEVARRAMSLTPHILAVIDKGNQNAITDGCVAMLCARTAVLGAILNVRINLGSIRDTEFTSALAAECGKLEMEVNKLETEALRKAYAVI